MILGLTSHWREESKVISSGFKTTKPLKSKFRPKIKRKKKWAKSRVLQRYNLDKPPSKPRRHTKVWQYKRLSKLYQQAKSTQDWQQTKRKIPSENKIPNREIITWRIPTKRYNKEWDIHWNTPNERYQLRDVKERDNTLPKEREVPNKPNPL